MSYYINTIWMKIAVDAIPTFSQKPDGLQDNILTPKYNQHRCNEECYSSHCHLKEPVLEVISVIQSGVGMRALF
jgi:hypothetical protein